MTCEASIDWLGWLDSSGIANNLIADAIFTTVVLGGALAWLERRRWKPARTRLLTSLKRACEQGLIAWGRNAQPPRINFDESGIQVSAERMKSLADQLRAELTALRSTGRPHVDGSERPPAYWRAHIYGLSTIRSYLALAIDRAQLTLHGEPKIVRAIADLENWYLSIPDMNERLKELEAAQLNPQLQAVARQTYENESRRYAEAVVQTYEGILALWDALRDVPGLSA